MTSEYLLDSMGLIDDELIQEAEEVPAKVVPLRALFRRWGSAAACLVLVLSLGYALTHLGMGGKSASSSTAAAGSGLPACSAQDNEAGGDHFMAPNGDSATGASSAAADSEDPEADWMGFRVLVTVDGLTYAYTHAYSPTEDHGPWVEALPEGCRSVGTVVNQENDLLLPHTDTGAYVGCPLWLEGEARESTLYLELPQGGYLVCEYSQTYDFSPGGRG